MIDIGESVEKTLGIKLSEYQETYIRELVNAHGSVQIIYASEGYSVIAPAKGGKKK